MECAKCGTCCVAPDIVALAKPVGGRCPHLGAALLCGIYDERPAVCRRYRPDGICAEIAAPTLAERVARYRQLFDI